METQGSNGKAGTTGNGNGNTGQTWQTEADGHGQKGDLMDEARKAARDRAVSEADHQRQTASRAISDSARALDKAAESLNEQGQPTLARTTSSIASGLTDLSQRLEQSNSDQLFQDITRLARQNPTLFILGGVGAGLVLSRFLKASSGSSGGHH